MKLTDRDRELIYLIYAHRYLRTDQLRDLSLAWEEPFTSSQMLWRRLRLLVEHGYLTKLDARRQRNRVYCLAKQGAQIVAASLQLALKQIPHGTRGASRDLDHELAIADCRVAIERSVAAHDQDVDKVGWVPEAELRRQKVQVAVPRNASRIGLCPDGLIAFPDPNGLLEQAFIEVDLGTESLDVFKDKVVAYQHYQSGFPQYRSDMSFKVLTVADSEPRMQNLLAITEDADGDRRFAFTTLDELAPETFFDGIWRVAKLSKGAENDRSEVGELPASSPVPSVSTLRTPSFSSPSAGFSSLGSARLGRRITFG